MENLSTLAKMNPKALNEMYNPETGAWSKLIAGLASVGYGGGIAIPVARKVNKMLTNDESIDKIIKFVLDEEYGKNASKKMIEAAKKPYGKLKNISTSYAVIPGEQQNGE